MATKTSKLISQESFAKAGKGIWDPQPTIYKVVITFHCSQGSENTEEHQLHPELYLQPIEGEGALDPRDLASGEVLPVSGFETVFDVSEINERNISLREQEKKYPKSSA